MFFRRNVSLLFASLFLCTATSIQVIRENRYVQATKTAVCAKNYFMVSGTMLANIHEGVVPMTRKIQLLIASQPEFKRILTSSTSSAHEEPFRSFFHLRSCLKSSKDRAFSKAFLTLLTDDMLALWCYQDVKTNNGAQHPNDFSTTSNSQPSHHTQGNYLATPYHCWWLQIQRHPDYSRYCKHELAINFGNPASNLYDNSNLVFNYQDYWANWHQPSLWYNRGAGFIGDLRSHQRFRKSRALVNSLSSSQPFSSNCIHEFGGVMNNLAALTSNPYPTAAKTAQNEAFLGFMRGIEDPHGKDGKFFAELNHCLLSLPDPAMAKKILVLSADDIMLLSCFYRNFGEESLKSLARGSSFSY